MVFGTTKVCRFMQALYYMEDLWQVLC